MKSQNQIQKMLDSFRDELKSYENDSSFDGDLRAPKKTKVLWLGTEKNSKNPTSFGYFATLEEKISLLQEILDG